MAADVAIVDFFKMPLLRRGLTDYYHIGVHNILHKKI